MHTDFSPFFGNERVQALNRARDEQAAELADLPGAVVHARTFSTDDPIKLGWDHLRKIMSEEGMVTVRGVNVAMVEAAKQGLSDFEPKLHIWDLFMADTLAFETVFKCVMLNLETRRSSEIPDDVRALASKWIESQ